MRCHRTPFKFQVTHVGYRETWKEKGVVKAYSMKRSHPNCPLPCARLKSFTSLDNTSLIWATRTSDIDVPYAVLKYRMDGETCRYWFVHQSKCLGGSVRPQSSPLKIVRRILNRFRALSSCIWDCIQRELAWSLWTKRKSREHFPSQQSEPIQLSITTKKIEN